jgi:ubiquinone/menaquinone biosynthesis C-methylase UbiE
LIVAKKTKAVEPIAPVVDEVVETKPAVVEPPFEESYFAAMKKSGVDIFSKGAWQMMYAHFIDTIFKIRGQVVLDLGCAAGAITAAFSDYGARAVGLDISKYATEKSQFKNIEMVNSPAWDLSMVEDDCIDFVHSMQLFQYIPEDKCPVMMAEIKRVCKNGAIVFAILDMRHKTKADAAEETIQPKYFWDEIAQDLGMKDGSKAYYQKLYSTHAPGWDFMKRYQWPYLLYKVVK